MADMLGDGNRLEGLFSPIYFDFDQSFIRPADRGALQEVAQYLNDNTGSKLLVEGHCDWRGTTEYNMALGDRRANSVTTYLEQIGVSANLCYRDRFPKRGPSRAAVNSGHGGDSGNCDGTGCLDRMDPHQRRAPA